MDFAKSLKNARKESALSQGKLSKITNLHTTAISRYEQGGSIPSIEAAYNIAKAMGISLDRLCGLESSKDGELAALFNRAQSLDTKRRNALMIVIKALLNDK